MPRFDGTGPIGQGSMTGGGRGYCAVVLNGSGLRQENTRGLYGKGGGRGHRNCFHADGLPGWVRAQTGMQAFSNFGRVVSNIDELVILKNQAGYFKDELDFIQARIQDLEGKQEEKK